MTAVKPDPSIPQAIVDHYVSLIQQGYSIGIHGPSASSVVEVARNGKLVVSKDGDEEWQKVEEFLKESGASEHTVRVAQLIQDVLTSRFGDRQSKEPHQNEALRYQLSRNQASAEIIDSNSPSDGPKGPSSSH